MEEEHQGDCHFDYLFQIRVGVENNLHFPFACCDGSSDYTEPGASAMAAITADTAIKLRGPLTPPLPLLPRYF